MRIRARTDEAELMVAFIFDFIGKTLVITLSAFVVLSFPCYGSEATLITEQAGDKNMELQWFEKYDGQRTDELIALENKFRKDSLVSAFERAVWQKEERLGADKLSDEERIILAVESLEREVNNGGYLQFFVNTPEFVPMIVEALHSIGSSETAKLTQKAIDALKIEGPLTIPKVDEAVLLAAEEEDPDQEEIWDDCDQFYYDEIGDLSVLLFVFIKKNRERISIP